jgi:hypothetical protein
MCGEAAQLAVSDFVLAKLVGFFAGFQQTQV